MFAAACFGCDALVAKHEANHDDYSKIMAQVQCRSWRTLVCFATLATHLTVDDGQALADRIAEAFAEALHREIRTDIWGYSESEKTKVPPWACTQRPME